jgi:hypothetical protein
MGGQEGRWAEERGRERSEGRKDRERDLRKLGEREGRGRKGKKVYEKGK